MTMFFVPIPEPDLNRSSRRIRTALLDIVDALAPVDINYHKKYFGCLAFIYSALKGPYSSTV